MRLSLAKIEEASRLIDPVFTNSPQFSVDSLNDALGFEIICKIETLNPIRSFKGRGADYFIHKHDGDLRSMVCASAGNFGQGMAYAARKRDLKLIVFAAKNANPLKIERMRALGAEVVLAGRDFDEAKQFARDFADTNGSIFVEDGREVAIAEGAGTIGLELSRYPLPFDAVLVPLGNGALLTGVGRWFKAIAPKTKVIGVVAEGAPAMERSWRAGHSISTDRVNTIADGIAVRVPIDEALDDLKFAVDEILLVDDRTILKAMKLFFGKFGMVAEPAGVAGLAAAIENKQRFSDLRLATIVCGGNLTDEQIRSWLIEEERC